MYRCGGLLTLFCFVSTGKAGTISSPHRWALGASKFYKWVCSESESERLSLKEKSAKTKSAHRTKNACLIIILAILVVLVISICHQWCHKAITVSQMSLSVSTKAPRKEVQLHCPPTPPLPPFASQWSSLSQPREPNIAGGNPCHASDDYEIFYICKTLPEEQRTQDIES